MLLCKLKASIFWKQSFFPNRFLLGLSLSLGIATNILEFNFLAISTVDRLIILFEPPFCRLRLTLVFVVLTINMDLILRFLSLRARLDY